MDFPPAILDTLYTNLIERKLPMKLNVSNTGRTITLSFKQVDNPAEAYNIAFFDNTIFLVPDPNGRKVAGGCISVPASYYRQWPKHGKINLTFTSDNEGIFKAELPAILPEPRQLQRSLKEEPAVPPAVTYPVSLTLVGKRHSFNIPLEELVTVALDWMKKGYGA